MVFGTFLTTPVLQPAKVWWHRSRVKYHETDDKELVPKQKAKWTDLSLTAIPGLPGSTHPPGLW